MSKIGLIVEGGGMKCAYSAGILDAFLDDNIIFDYVLGVSAGSANAASFLAGQRGRNRRFYTDHIHEPGYFGLKSLLKTGNLFGLEYIYRTLSNSNGDDPLNFDAIQANPTEYKVVATDAVTGLPHAFDKSEMEKDNYIEIMASSALPAMCRPVNVRGHKYFDGGVSDSYPYNQAFSDGCDKLVIISSKNRDFVKKPEGHKKIYSIICRRYPKIVEDLNNRHIMYAQERKEIFEMEKQGKVFLFSPSEHLAMSTYAMDENANQKLYELGLNDYANLKEELLKFMNKKIEIA
ncbi:MAG: patatin family protein [Butyrivibrio sp.]|nr:patatin family protein [Butyrivibrio sp.]